MHAYLVLWVASVLESGEVEQFAPVEDVSPEAVFECLLDAAQRRGVAERV